MDTPFRLHGIPQEFLDHAKRDAILERIGLTAQALARGIVEDVTALDRAREAPALGCPERHPCRVPARPRPAGLTRPRRPTPAGRDRGRPRAAAGARRLRRTTTRTTVVGGDTGSQLAEAIVQEQRILNQRARAVRDHNLGARSCGGSTTATRALMARQRRYFRNLVQLPLARFAYKVTSEQWEGLRMSPRAGVTTSTSRRSR